jgi:hypothetical protein
VPLLSPHTFAAVIFALVPRAGIRVTRGREQGSLRSSGVSDPKDKRDRRPHDRVFRLRGDFAASRNPRDRCHHLPGRTSEPPARCNLKCFAPS